MTTTTIRTPQVGEIIYAQGGYDCTLTSFYKVIKRTPTTVTLQEIGKGFTEQNAGQFSSQALVAPIAEIEIGKPITRKVKISNYGREDYWTVRINSYLFAQDIYETGSVQETAPGWY